jgi:sporulation integral membrane protein YtvI
MLNDPKQRIRWARWGFLGGVMLCAIGVLWTARQVMMPFVLAAVLAYLLAPLVQWFVDRGKMSRVAAILCAYGLVATAATALFLYMIPDVVRESEHFIQTVPALAQALQNTWNQWLARFHQAPIPQGLRGHIHQAAVMLEARLFDGLKGVLHSLFHVVPGVLSALIAPVLAFYWLKDWERMRERFWEVVPVGWHPGLFRLGVDLDRALNGYVRGQLLVAVMVGALSAAWMLALRLPYAALIGMVAGVTDVIPYLGPIAGAVPAVLLAFSRSPWLAVYVVAGFVVIHQLEGTVIAPKVVGDSVGLHPLVVIAAILVGGALFGFWGLIFGVPLASVVKVLLVHGYRRLTVTLDRDSLRSVQ